MLAAVDRRRHSFTTATVGQRAVSAAFAIASGHRVSFGVSRIGRIVSHRQVNRPSRSPLIVDSPPSSLSRRHPAGCHPVILVHRRRRVVRCR
ncbi:MAG: hypothetical protein U5K73_11150 [Halofilum sp. (in: g-proteobacteria)]|nr:hypothetical protein [Halofilum sp. (in: g-proteobacteria)]